MVRHDGRPPHPPTPSLSGGGATATGPVRMPNLSAPGALPRGALGVCRSHWSGAEW